MLIIKNIYYVIFLKNKNKSNFLKKKRDIN